MRRIWMLVGLLGASGAYAKKPPVNVILLDSFADQDTTLGAAAVAQKVTSSYIAPIRRCYTPLSDLSGTLELHFTVTEAGKVDDAKATSFDEGLEQCVVDAMRTWTFGKPKLRGQPIAATFKLMLALDSTGRSKKQIVADLHADGADAFGGDDDDRRAGTRIATTTATDDRPFSAELVLSKIQTSYMKGLRACYNRAPRAGLDRMTVSFDVNAKGRTINVRVRGAYPRLRSCMASQIDAWSFPAPADAPAHFDVPFTQ